MASDPDATSLSEHIFIPALLNPVGLVKFPPYPLSPLADVIKLT